MTTIPGDQLPKGMEIPVPEPQPTEETRLPITLAEINYIGLIHEALAQLPFHITVMELQVNEGVGQISSVQLAIQIGPHKGEPVV